MKGGFVSKSMGDLPEFREDEDDEIWGIPPNRSSVRGRRSTNNWDKPRTEWAGSPQQGNNGRQNSNDDDLFDGEDLPEPGEKAPSRFSLFKRGGSLTAEGEKLRPSKYGAFRDAPLEREELTSDDPFGPPVIPASRRQKRDRSSSFSGRIRSLFSSSKYEGLGPLNLGAPGDDLLQESAPSQTDEGETKFNNIHYTKRDHYTKSKEEATVSVAFSRKGIFIEEQPSGDYLDDIAPSVVKKYFVDPTAGSFSLQICRKSSYASTPQSEYTVTLVTRYFDLMMACWKEVIKGHGDAMAPRDIAFEDVLSSRRGSFSPPTSYGHNTPFGQEEYVPRSSSSGRLDSKFDPFADEDTDGQSRKPKYNPHSFSTSDLPTAKHYAQPPKKDLLIDL